MTSMPMTESLRTALKVGHGYTRREIHDLLGGDMRSYLPHKDGRVVAVCAKEDHNPDVRRGILDSGHGPEVERWTEVLVNQGSAVPIFVQVAQSNTWEFIGYWRPHAYVTKSSKGSLIAERDRICRAGIPDRQILRVVMMEPVDI
jgi:hypothetical protein